MTSIQETVLTAAAAVARITCSCYGGVVKTMSAVFVKKFLNDGSRVRIAAAESLPYLLECAQIKGQSYVMDMWNYICPELIKAIDSEPESEVLSEHINSMAKVRT